MVLSRRHLARAALAACLGLGALPAGSAAAEAPRVFTFAGTGETLFAGSGWPATQADVSPAGIAALADGSLLIADGSRPRVWRVGRDGVIRAVAGTGKNGYSGDGGSARKARLSWLSDVAAIPGGGFLVIDADRVRRVGRDGVITTVAGTLASPRRLAALPDGGFLIVDGERVKRVDAAGSTTTVAGSEQAGFAGDGGPAAGARLQRPLGLAALPDGGFLIADTGNNRIRRVDAKGVIATVAGSGRYGFSGDGGPALAARLRSPEAVAALPDGGFLVSDTGNDRVRHVAADGTITTVAGSGGSGFGGDGSLARRAAIGSPGALAVLPDLSFVVATWSRVRLVAGPRSPLLGLAWADAGGDLARRASYRTRVLLGAPGRVELEVYRGSKRVGHASRRVRGSHWVPLRALGDFTRPGIYDVLVTATGRGPTSTMQVRTVVFGGVLLDRWAVDIADGDERTRVLRARNSDWDETREYRSRTCVRFGPALVDCRIEVSINGDPYECDSVRRIVLRADGQIYTRPYRCPSRRGVPVFKRHPSRWSGGLGRVWLEALR